MTRVLITGASGFLGGALMEYLKDFPQYEVVGTSTGNRTDLVQCDITEPTQVEALIQSLQPEIIVHCAALPTVTKGDPIDYYRINTLGTESIISSVISLPHKARFIFISTAGVYGNQETEVLSEDLHPLPVHHYGLSKFSCERLLANYFEMADITILRPFNIIGPGQDDYFIVPKLANAFATRQAEIRLGNIDVFRDYIGIEQVSEIIHAFFDCPESHGEIVNLCTGKATSLRDLLDAFAQIAGYEISVISAPEFIRKFEVWRLIGSREKLDRLLKDRARPTVIYDTLKNMVESIKNARKD